jgi:hypothetical protein
LSLALSGPCFVAAGLPLARVSAQPHYDTDEVRVHLRQTMARAAKAPSPTEEPAAEPQDQSQDCDQLAPACPRCGVPMVLREVKRDGPRQGEQFWGCPNFPRCRGTRDVEDTA